MTDLLMIVGVSLTTGSLLWYTSMEIADSRPCVIYVPSQRYAVSVVWDSNTMYSGLGWVEIWLYGEIVHCRSTWACPRLTSGRHTHTQAFNCLWSGITRVGLYQKKHSPTHTHPESWSLDILYYLPPFTTINGILFVHFTCLTVLSLQPLSRSSLVFLLALDPQLHTPYISSPNHHLLFAAHAGTNAAWRRETTWCMNVSHPLVF